MHQNLGKVVEQQVQVSSLSTCLACGAMGAAVAKRFWGVKLPQAGAGLTAI